MTIPTLTIAEVTRRTRGRALLIGGVLPALIALGGALLTISWIPELPDPIAIHWSGNGPDGFGSVWTNVLVIPAIVIVFAAFAVGVAYRVTPRGLLSWTQKFVLVTSLWMATMITVGITASVAGQRGLADARQAPDVEISLLIGAGIGLVLAAAAWFLLPASDTIEPNGEAPAPLEVSATERVSWTQTVMMSGLVLALLGGSTLLVLVLSVVTFSTSPEAGLISFGTFVLLLVAVACTTWWRVTADHRGLLVRGFLGWPRLTIRPEDIRDVAVVQVNPMSEFGGWGWRWAGNGRSGIVTHAGPGIEVTRANGKRFVITVNDAETGAAVLASVARQG